MHDDILVTCCNVDRKTIYGELKLTSMKQIEMFTGIKEPHSFPSSNQ